MRAGIRPDVEASGGRLDHKAQAPLPAATEMTQNCPRTSGFDRRRSDPARARRNRCVDGSDAGILRRGTREPFPASTIETRDCKIGEAGGLDHDALEARHRTAGRVGEQSAQRLFPARSTRCNSSCYRRRLLWRGARLVERAADDLTRHCVGQLAVIEQYGAVLVALCAGLVLSALGWTSAAEAIEVGPCPRPSDQYGALYETVSGAYRSRGVSPGGGNFVTIMPRDGAAPVSVNVTERVFNIAGSLTIGTPITLVSYLKDSLSGAQPPYSCIEPAR
jgi:hypothetical protein